MSNDLSLFANKWVRAASAATLVFGVAGIYDASTNTAFNPLTQISDLKANSGAEASCVRYFTYTAQNKVVEYSLQNTPDGMIIRRPKAGDLSVSHQAFLTCANKEIAAQKRVFYHLASIYSIFSLASLAAGFWGSRKKGKDDAAKLVIT